MPSLRAASRGSAAEPSASATATSRWIERRAPSPPPRRADADLPSPPDCAPLPVQVLIDISKVQDDEVGDGTPSVCVLAGEFLRQAQELIEKKIHPQTIVRGYRLAREAAIAAVADVPHLEAMLLNCSSPSAIGAAMPRLPEELLAERVGRIAAAHLEAVAAHHALDDHLRRFDGKRLQEEDRAQRWCAWMRGRSGELQVGGAGEDDAALHDVVGDQGVQWPRGG